MEHDHGDHGGGDMSCPMIMTFHIGHCETILFDTWVTDTVVKFVFSALGIFVIAFLYEGLKFWREKYFVDVFDTYVSNREIVSHCGGVPQESKVQKTTRERIFSKYHIIQTVIHLFQVTVSYGLMLVVMTFNIWLILAIVLGAACGYFLFGWMRERTIDLAEYCH